MRSRVACALLAAMALWTASATAQGLPSNWSSRPYEGGTLYEPRDLPAGSAFSLWAPPPSNVGGAGHLQAFHQARRDGLRGLDVSGMSPNCEDAAVSSQGAITQNCRVSGGGKPPFNIQFFMLPVRNGQAQWYRVVAAGDPQLLERYKDDFRTVLDVAVKAPPAQAATAQAARPAEKPAPRAASKAQDEREAIERAVRAEPGQGLKPNEYETILYSWQQVYRVTGLQFEQTVYLLMKDGSAYEGLELAPEDFNAKASRQLQPRHWVQWRKSGKTYQVRSADGKEWRSLQAWPAVPGRRDERLSKTYTNHWYQSMGGLGGSAATSSYAFMADGRFEQHGHSIHGTGVMQANNGFNASTSTTYSRKGTSTSTTVSGGALDPMDSPAVAGGSHASRNNGAAHTGRYRIDGWRIEIQRDNGQVDRKLFLFTSEKRDSLMIGDTYYSLPSK